MNIPKAVKERSKLVQKHMEELSNMSMTDHYPDKKQLKETLDRLRMYSKKRKFIATKIKSGVTYSEEVLQMYTGDTSPYVNEILKPIEQKYDILEEDMKKLRSLIDVTKNIFNREKVNRTGLKEKLNVIEQSMNKPLDVIDLFASVIDDDDLAGNLQEFVRRVRNKFNNSQ